MFFFLGQRFLFFSLQQTQEKKPKAARCICTAILFTSLVLSLKINERDDGDGEQHQRDRDDGPPTSSRATVRFCSLSAFFSSSFVFFCVRECFPACCISGGRSTLSTFSFSLFPVQMAPSIWTSKVFRNLAKTNERTVLRAEVTPGFRQARDIRHRG